VGLTVLDASVLIGLLDATDAHHEAAKSAIGERVAASDRLVVPASAYAELLVGPIRRGPEAVATVDALLRALSAEVLALDSEMARAAASLRAHHPGRLRLRDAFVLGTAVELGADLVLTADRRWPSIDGLSITVLGGGAVT
jgi:predicted nucleic acid-binding protein